MRKYFAAAALVLGLATPALVSAPASAALRLADCLVTAGGDIWIDGPCSFTSYGGGAFMVRGSGGGWAKVVPFAPGIASGGNMGTLYQNGACWTNDYARVCAWQPGEPRWF
jgi:hypothetical protein